MTSVTRSLFALEQGMGQLEAGRACGTTAARRAALRKICAELEDLVIP